MAVWDCKKFEFTDIAKHTPEAAVAAVLNSVDKAGLEDVVSVSIVRPSDRGQFTFYELYVVTKTKTKP